MAPENAQDLAAPLVELRLLTITQLDTQLGSFEFAGQIVPAIAHHRVMKTLHILIAALDQVR
ncbi:hypothetical protein FQZ97_1070050 [compost metagenome]